MKVSFTVMSRCFISYSNCCCCSHQITEILRSPSAKICTLLDQYFSDIEVIEESEAKHVDKSLFAKLKQLISDEANRAEPSYAHIRLLMHVITGLSEYASSIKMMIKADICTTLRAVFDMLIKFYGTKNDHWRLAMNNFMAAISSMTIVPEGS